MADYPHHNCAMRDRGLSFRQVLEEACAHVPEVWDGDERLKVARVAKYCAKHGHPVSQSTLSRHYRGSHEGPRALDNETVDALSAVFDVPKELWRGELPGGKMGEDLERYSLSDILLAKKLAELPRKDRRAIEAQIEAVLEREDALKRAVAGGNVTPIERSRR